MARKAAITAEALEGLGVPALAALGLVAAGTTVEAQDKIKLRVMGMPLATGNIQKLREQPFFENLAQRTGLPFEVEYKPLDVTGIKEFEQLRSGRLTSRKISSGSIWSASTRITTRRSAW